MLFVVLDTNIFVAAGFNPGSASARILDEIRANRVTLVWDRATRREVETVLQKIPPLRWDAVAPLFQPDAEHQHRSDHSEVGFVEDPHDRKFAALAVSTGATLVSADDHLLSHRDRLDVARPNEFLRRVSSSGVKKPAI